MENHEFHRQILARLDSIDEKMAEMSEKVDPMYEIFSSVSGFNKIAMWILKLLAAVGAGIIGLYAFLEFLRRLK